MPPDNEDGVQYSFALEYNGPPLPYDLPRAVPINVNKIPVAAVVSQLSIPDKLSLPVVKPLLPASDPGKRSPNLSKEPGSEEATTTVSPTSVIERATESNHHQDCGLSGELSSSGALEFSTGSGVLLNGGRSSSTIEFSDSFDNKSRESSSRLRISNELNQDWESNESVLSIDHYPSSRVSSVKENGACCNEVLGDYKRTQVVTFVDVESDSGVGVAGVDDDNEEFGEDEERFSRQVKREPQNKGKKGTCYRCFKGNRFTEKEVCIVCDAKYCSNCVLRAMGSMPEGRKCVSCIGYPIDESKRGSLGKCSRMLKRLLNDLEVRQIMKAEKLCESNQLPPEYVCVNGMPLCHEELVVLQTCPSPPKKLKPGNYWYDKVSGLWGKEGQKPSQIISPHLNVGGPINADASNGNTQVYINGREITKVELRMLQLAGVQCAGNPHFWVNEDGSYQEEGQKNTKGYIWGKAGMKLVCTFLSLPVPSKSSNSLGEQVNSGVSRSVPDYLEQRTLLKILLVGYNGSGTSTIFKQAKILYKPVPFTEDERENIKLTIQSNVYGYLGILLEGRDRFEEESLAVIKKEHSSDEIDPSGSTSSINGTTIYSIGPRLKAFSDWLLKIMVSGNLEVIFPAATREYAPLVEELWRDPAIQATYNRKSELEMLPSVASYFLERAADILRPDYEPSDLDILYAEGVTSSNGLACLEFSYPLSAPDDKFDSDDQHDSLLRYQLISVHARGFGENCKWLEMFEDVGMVIFCVALSDYDQYAIDGNGCSTNKMLLSRRFFESIVTHPTFDQMDFLLILNKFDLFEEKVERVSLTHCEWFDDFHPVVSHHRSNSNSNSINSSPSLGQLGFHYIAVKFKKLYASLTGKKLYVSMVKGLEPDSVDASLKYAREILKWDEERHNFSLSEYSFYSTEASSYSP
ncbi:extra-large guanine nucleotide-binding protein 1 [Ricinus communis]|uniref:GTP-binding protein alpha subunit, gna, putative n=1 Tax=Ricinus communis TaxID=3988 RepID=B9S8Q3_RICCO|nr:extra-large guanine nucleotide-binding protein 1 [Ricinus communis]EEF40056.1 GTP-binding protein alpha subunit, gna, putative [Ricinus communis]|eukprot:XP_002522372.1 extra-large guanine nucleotide-binding protein 1 [Ricinus communis]